MTYRLFLTREATQDATEGFEWYERKQPGLGKKFLDELDRYFFRILQAPHQFPKDQDQHVAVINKFPFRIVFEVDDEQITVFSIYHDKRDPGRLPARKNHD